MRKTSVQTATVILVIALATLTYAADQDRYIRRSRSSESDISRITDLQLTAAQIDEIRLLKESHFKNIKPLQDDIRARRLALRALWLKKSPDRYTIETAYGEILAARDRLRDRLNEYHLAVFGILTPEQQIVVKSAIRKRQYNPGCRWGKELQNENRTGS